MISAAQARAMAPKPPASTTKQDVLIWVEERIKNAAPQGARSIWITAEDGYRQGDSSAVLLEAIDVLKEEFEVVEELHNGLPSIRVRWE